MQKESTILQKSKERDINLFIHTQAILFWKNQNNVSSLEFDQIRGIFIHETFPEFLEPYVDFDMTIFSFHFAAEVYFLAESE